MHQPPNALIRCNRAKTGRLQALFGRHISHAKGRHNLDCPIWLESPGCRLNSPSGITRLRFKPAENSGWSKPGSAACTVRKNDMVLPPLHDLTQIVLDALKDKIMRIENIKYQT